MITHSGLPWPIGLTIGGPLLPELAELFDDGTEHRILAWNDSCGPSSRLRTSHRRRRRLADWSRLFHCRRLLFRDWRFELAFEYFAQLM